MRIRERCVPDGEQILHTVLRLSFEVRREIRDGEDLPEAVRRLVVLVGIVPLALEARGHLDMI